MTTASRSIHWSKFFAVLATVLRLGGGLTSFLIQARFLGPYQFGVIGAAMTIAALTSLLSDFGLNTYAMHWGSAQPERRDFLIPLCVIVKAILSAMLLLPCLVWVHLSGFAADKQIAAALAIIGFLAAATGDVALVGLRVQSLFEKETIIVAWTTFVSLPLLIVVVIVSRDVLLTALAFAAGRAVYLVAALNAIRPTLAAFRTTPRGMVRDGVALLVSSKEYAVDLILTNCVNQIDVVIMSLFVDTVSIGLYMAATRLVENGLPIVSMLATVYLPPLAGYHANAKTSD